MFTYKKRALALTLLLLTLTSLLLTSCKSRLAYDAFDCDLKEYIKVGSLDKIEVSRSTVEATLYNRMHSIVWENSLYTEVTESAKAETHDKLKVDYTCEIDGLVIDAFGKKDAAVVIGSGNMIPGFEDGLIGMSTSDEPKVLELTFPEDYYSDLGGKKAIFTVTVKAIYRPQELTDEIVTRYTKHASVQDMKDSLTRVIASELAYTKLLEEAEVIKYPETEYNAYYNDVTYLETYAKDQNMTVEKFLAEYGDQFTEFGFKKGMTEAEYKTACKEFAEKMTKEDMLVYYLLREMDVTTGGSAYSDMKERLLRDNDASDIEEYEKIYGEGSLEQNIKYNLALEALYERIELK